MQKLELHFGASVFAPPDFEKVCAGTLMWNVLRGLARERRGPSKRLRPDRVGGWEQRRRGLYGACTARRTMNRCPFR